MPTMPTIVTTEFGAKSQLGLRAIVMRLVASGRGWLCCWPEEVGGRVEEERDRVRDRKKNKFGTTDRFREGWARKTSSVQVSLIEWQTKMLVPHRLDIKISTV